VLFLTLLLWQAPAAGIAQPAEPTPTANEALTLCLADACALPPEVASRRRYFYLPRDDREHWWPLVNFHCNGLNRNPLIERVRPMLRSGGTLAWIDLSWYGWTPAQWEKLSAVEPYFQVKVREFQAAVPVVKPVPWPGGPWWEDGRYYPPGAFTYYPHGKPAAALRDTGKVYTAPGSPAVDGRVLAELATKTQTAAPFVRADWFLWQTAQNQKRGGVGYYHFLGVKSRKDYDTIAGFSKQLARDAKVFDAADAVAASTVTLQPRRLAVDHGTTGKVYESFDVREAVGDKNPLRNLNGLDFEATEFFVHLPHGMMAWGLADNKGVLQDAAPPDIAGDSTAHGTDKQVHVGLSCVRCHGPHGGVQPIDGWIRGLEKDGLGLTTQDYHKADEVAFRYRQALEPLLEEGRQKYERACKKATKGLGVRDAAAGYGAAFAAYDAPKTLEDAARDLGVTPAVVVRALDDYRVRTQQLDPVLAGFLRRPSRSLPVTAYHEVYQTMAAIVKGAKP
jgi:hypothetical protein